MMKVITIVVLHLSSQVSNAFTTLQPRNGIHRPTLSQRALSEKDISIPSPTNEENDRRSFLQTTLTSIVGGTTTASAFISTFTPSPANALVKGNAPPPKKKSSDGERKCTNVEECQEMAERLAAQQDEEMKLNAIPPKIAPKGTRYLDMVNVDDSNALLVREGDVATVHYKVLKLGKRSYDGLSGEGTVVFSRGYGLEDDENKPGEKAFSFTVGDSTVIAALNDALPGMKIGETRRLTVLPQMGWEKPDRSCDGGPGGSGAGGDLKTDYVVVPTATMVATETCFDKSKLPFPDRYDQQRRMAQRFDQSLIMEVELVNFKS